MKNFHMLAAWLFGVIAFLGGGHPLDVEAMRPLLNDPRVKAWVKAMGSYLPLKRNS
jgi:hypothetical protein